MDCPELIYVWKDIVKPFHNVASGLRGERLHSERLAGHQIPDASLGDIEMDLPTGKVGATAVV